MKIHRIFLVAVFLLWASSALHAAPQGPLRLAAARHTFDRAGESLTFVFQDAGGRPASSIPRPDVTYSETRRYLRLVFEGVVSQLAEAKAEGTAVSSIEVQTLRGRTIVYVFLKKPVRYFLRDSRRTGSLVLGLYDVGGGGCWVRVDAHHWRSSEAVYPFWVVLKKAAVMTCLLQDETGAYFLSTTGAYDSLERAAQVRKTVQAVIDAFVDGDPFQPSRPVASVCTVADAAGVSDLPVPAGELAEQINALVEKLPDDPADIHAGMRHERISDTMRELVKIGRPAVPALALATTSRDDRLRRTALLTLSAIGGGDVEQFLIDGLQESEPAVRQEMVLALERLPLTRAVLVALDHSLQDGDKWVRFFAARALTRAWVPAAVPVMMKLLADDEVRDEAADIIHRHITAEVSSEIFAGMTEEKTGATIRKLLADWEVDREFVMPALSLADSADILERVFGRIYKGGRVRCRVDEKSGEVVMTRRGHEAGSREVKRSRVHIVQRMVGNLDSDAALEEVVIVGEEGSVPSDMAVLDDPHHRGAVLWIRSLDANAPTGGARACLADADGDGVCEIILMVMTKIRGVRNVRAAIYRRSGDGFHAVFSGDVFKEEKPQGRFDRPKEKRSFIRFERCKGRPPKLVLDVITRTGTGNNASVSGETVTHEWKDGAYDMSETVVHAPSGETEGGDVQPGQTRSTMEIIVDKSDGKLYVYIDGGLKKTYDAKFGSVEGDKEIEGDRKTPEGEFYICVKNPHSRYRLSLGLSYPGREDAERGLREGLITKEQHDRIVAAIERRAVPPWKTRLGGEIFIHGYSGPGGTLGCIALSNEDIEELYKIANVGTRVVIRP